MNMKKLTTIVLALVMALSLCSTAFATENSGKATITTVDDAQKQNQQQINVTGSYDGTTVDTYSVDVKWDAMEFVYTANDQTQWNPEKHTYDLKTGGTAAAWSALNGDTVTVTNHSNKAVKVEFAFEKADGVNGLYTGTFDKTEATLAAGVENDPDNADKVVAKLTLNGTLAAGTVSTKLGTITVHISAA